MNAGTKLARLETALAVLEKAAGITVDYEVVRQNPDGSYPEPTTDAPIVVEVQRFRASGRSSSRTQVTAQVDDGNCQADTRCS